MRSLHLAVLLAVLLAVALDLVLAPAATAGRSLPPHHAKLRSRRDWAIGSMEGGARAALGDAMLQRLAASAGLAPGHVLRNLDQDDDLSVDTQSEALLFTCSALVATGVEAAAATDATLQPAASAPDPQLAAPQVFALHSRPGSQHRILLDFTGCTTSGSSWNTLTGLAVITTPPYDKDGNAAAWSADELSDIVAIWRAVAEDYAAWDVDVTTDEAALGDSGPVPGGVRAAIGGSWADWWGAQAGGVSYVGGFNRSTQQPAFVFSRNLGPEFAKFVWEAVSHEVGHTLGLTHDGTTSGATYYAGDGEWAPIMGTAYSKQLTTFDRGEFAGSNNPQDDFAVITSSLPLLPAPAGPSFSAAAPLAILAAPSDGNTSGNATAAASGVLSTPDAPIVFTFDAAAGPAAVAVAVLAPWAGTFARTNLVLSAALLAPDGTQLAAASGLGMAPLQALLPAPGTHYVVLGPAASSALAGMPSSYESRGCFELVATFTPCAAAGGCATPAPQLPSPSPGAGSSSPSPAPVAGVARVSQISMSKLTTSGGVVCTGTVYLKRSDTGAALPNVAVSVRWFAMQAGANLAPGTASSLVTGTAGAAAFRSPTWAAESSSTACNITIEGVAGWLLAPPPASLLWRTLAWA